GVPSSSATVTPGSISSASASVLTPRASKSAAERVALWPVRPRAISGAAGRRTPVTTTGARAAVSLGVESGCWARAGGGTKASIIAPASKGGVRSAECGVDVRPSTPHSALRTPHSVEGIQPGNLVPQDERMHILRPLVRVHRLEVGEVAHRLILRQDAVGAEEAVRLARHVGGDAHVV